LSSATSEAVCSVLNLCVVLTLETIDQYTWAAKAMDRIGGKSYVGPQLGPVIRALAAMQWLDQIPPNLVGGAMTEDQVRQIIEASKAKKNK